MKNILKISVVSALILFCVQLHAQQRISGFVRDAQSGEVLIGATVFDIQNKGGAITNHVGYFSLIVKPNATLRISFLGYESQQISVSSAKDSILQIALKLAQTTLGGVEITAQHYRPTFNVAGLTMEQISTIPSITGKPDVLKALQFLPGMRSMGEASSVTLVRGGNPGENMYLIDNTPLIHVHHIGGFMSVFNPDIINNIEVFKGGFPAKYGGKLSSIMNITQKSGNQPGFRGSYSVGISDISLALEGPTKLNNSSFIVTARKTLIDIFYLMITGSSNMYGAFLWYGFHDVNGKFTWSPNQRNTIAVNFYQGDDYLQLISKKSTRNDGRFRQGSIWGNWLGSVNWNHVFPSNLLLKNTLSFTHYRLRDVTKLTYNNKQIEDGAKNMHQTMQSSVQDISLRSQASYALMRNWDLDFGLQNSHLRFKPMVFHHNTLGIPEHNELIDALESALFVSNRIKPLSFFDAEIGLRGVGYFNSEISNFSLEPRLNANFYVTQNHVLNFSAMRVTQNTQLINNMGSLTANEIFVPSGKDIPVAYSNQFSFGYQTSFVNRMYEIEANYYYKTLRDLTTYKEGYGYSMGDIFWREKLETGGSGLARGVEFLFKKNSGRLSGFLGYTYSRSTRQFDGINNGKTFAFDFDSPHDFSISLAYQMSEKWSFGATWQFQTGLPFTPAIGRHIALDDDGFPYEVLIYGDRNSDRMRDYHRLDIAFKKQTYTRKRGRKAEWTLGIHNVYARQNPYFYYYSNSTHGGIYWNDWHTNRPIGLYQISMFSFIPMVSYKVWFGANSKNCQ
jgi:hypothetical protein